MYGKIARTGFTMDFLEEGGDVCLLVSKKWHFLLKKKALSLSESANPVCMTTPI
jgi:hypothetical protein